MFISILYFKEVIQNDFAAQTSVAYTPDDKKTTSFRNGSPLFNLQYLGQIFIKSSKQGQFRNQLVLRIPKLPLVVRFDKDLAEILEVEEKASISE